MDLNLKALKQEVDEFINNKNFDTEKYNFLLEKLNYLEIENIDNPDTYKQIKIELKKLKSVKKNISNNSTNEDSNNYDEDHKLKESHKMIINNIEKGVQMDSEIGRQTDKLKNNQSRLNNIFSVLGFSNNIIKQMQRRAKKNKIIYYCILFGSFVLIIFLLFLKFFN